MKKSNNSVEHLIFRTPRLKIRALALSDLPAFHKMQCNPVVMQYTGTAPMSKDENLADLQGVIERYDDPDNVLWVWAAITITDSTLIGTCALVDEGNSQFEIGVRLLEKEWGRGYGQEITKHLLCFAFNEWRAEFCVGYIMSDNGPSIKMAERYLNFQKEYFNEKDQVLDRIYQIDRIGLLAKGLHSKLI